MPHQSQDANVPTLPSADVVIDIPFHDVDALNMVWHGHYSKYFEIARCALLDKIDYNYPQMMASGYYWPVIDLQVRYAQPLRFQQKIKVTATIKEWEYRLLITYLITDVVTGQRLTRGRTAQVAVSAAGGEMLLASPPVLSAKLALATQ